MSGHGLINIHRRQRGNIKAGEPHIHNNGDFQRIVVVFELTGKLIFAGLVADDTAPFFGIVIAGSHHNSDFLIPSGTHFQKFPVNIHCNRAGVRHDHGFAGQFLRPVVFVVIHNVVAESFYGLWRTEDTFHLAQLFFAFFNGVSFGVLCKQFIFCVDPFQDILVKVQMDHSTFVKYRSGSAIFHSLSHIVNVNIVTENLAGVAVFLGDRSTGKTDKCCIGETVPDDPGSSDVNFSVLIDFFKAVLSPVSFIGHHHDIAPLGKG